MNINLNDEQMREVIGAAVMRTLDEDTRTTVIAAAIDHLMRPEKTYNGKSESPLQAAFNQAIQTIALQVAKEEMDGNDEVKEKLRSLLHESVDSLTQNKEESVNRIAGALADAMSRRDSF